MNMSARSTQAKSTDTFDSIGAIRKRNPFANLWFFQSPKNQTTLTIVGDVQFMHIVLLEGRPEVAHYILVSDPFNLERIPGKKANAGYIEVFYKGGRSERCVFSEANLELTRSSSPQTGDIPNGPHDSARNAAVVVLTEKDLRGKEILFNNWVTLCAFMTRARGASTGVETRLVYSILRDRERVRVGDLLDVPGVDPALMYAEIARVLQEGVAACELEKRYFTNESIIVAVTS